MDLQSGLSKTVSKLLVSSLLTSPFQLFMPAYALDVETVTGNARSLGLQQNQNAIDSFSREGELGIPETAYSSDLFPDDISTDPSSLQSLFGDENAMGGLGSDTKGRLFEDAYSDNPSILGEAYRVAVDQSQRSKPDFYNDPMMDSSKDVLANIESFKEDFANCTETTSLNRYTKTVHMSDYKYCQRVVDKSQSCTVNHRYEAGIFAHHSGPLNLQSCGVGCTNLWIGQVGDNYWGGWCQIYEQEMTVKILTPESIKSAVIDYAKWDDYIQIWIGEKGKEQKVWSGPNGNFPPETGGACELGTDWSARPYVDVTHILKSLSPNDLLNFKVRVSVSGYGEGFARLRVNYDPSKAVYIDEWSPMECIDAATGIYDGFAKGSVECINNPVDSNGCTYVNGIYVCNSSLKPSPLPNIPATCTQVNVQADYDFYKGELDCFEDITGELQCHTNTGGHLNKCKKYEDNPSCGFISSECLDGAEGGTGECYVHIDKYDCGISLPVEGVEATTEISCPGEIACLGTDCLELTEGKSEDFSKAAAMLHVAQFATQDMSCTGEDGLDNVNCKVFDGSDYECKVAVGGVQDCCNTPTNTTMYDYLKIIMAIPKLDAGMSSLADSGISSISNIGGSYNSLADPVKQTFSEITKPFTSFAEGIEGQVDQVVQPINDYIGEIVVKIEARIADLFKEGFSALGEAVGAGAGSGATSGATSAAPEEEAATKFTDTATGSALGYVMTAYTAYSVAVTVIKYAYECTEDEYTLNSKKELRSCVRVGSYCRKEVLGVCIEERESYCCFDSPISRIIQEQARPQLGMNFGSAEYPSCEGLAIDDLGKINWDEINLDEWVGLLSMYDLFPTANMDLDKVTGSGSHLNLDGSRKDAVSRTNERFMLNDNASKVDGIRKNLATEFYIDTGAGSGGESVEESTTSEPDSSLDPEVQDWLDQWYESQGEG